MSLPSAAFPSGPSTSAPGTTGHAGLRRVASTVLPTDEAVFEVHAFEDAQAGTEHVALVLGDVAPTAAGGPPLVRVHSECLTGDALGSHRCDCGDQLRAARAAIAAEGRGVVVYLRGHEGRGIGLAAKLRAYALQDGGLDTVDANLALGHAVDARDYRPAALVLLELGVDRVRLLSGNPAKQAALVDHGVMVVERRVLPVPAHPASRRYLHTKRTRMGHEVAPASLASSGPVAPRSVDGVDEVWLELLAGRVPAVLLREGQDPVAAVLVERYGPLLGDGPLVLGQLGQSVDGFIAARTGDAVHVTGDEDREHLHRLRALVDAVVVGAGTVTTDDCRLTVRAVPGPHPVRVVLDPHARVPLDRALFTDGEAPTLWCVAQGSAAEQQARSAVVTGTVGGHVVVVPVAAADGRFAPHDVLSALARRGLQRVLVEGGGVTVSQFLAAGALDLLLVTTAPLLIGDGVPGLRFDGTDRLRDALRAPSRRFVLGDDVCVELDLRARR